MCVFITLFYDKGYFWDAAIRVKGDQVVIIIFSRNYETFTMYLNRCLTFFFLIWVINNLRDKVNNIFKNGEILSTFF